MAGSWGCSSLSIQPPNNATPSYPCERLKIPVLIMIGNPRAVVNRIMANLTMLAIAAGLTGLLKSPVGVDLAYTLLSVYNVFA